MSEIWQRRSCYENRKAATAIKSLEVRAKVPSPPSLDRMAAISHSVITSLPLITCTNPKVSGQILPLKKGDV